MSVRAKKHLGQHFLADENIAKKIADSLATSEGLPMLEIGPGMGVLTKYLLGSHQEVFVAEIDVESIDYLQRNYPAIPQKNYLGDFLRLDLADLFPDQVQVIGNFPYNISSQILFKIIDYYTAVPVMAGMFQKEVAERTAAVPRTKAYGILSVLVQALYDVEYLFTVHENVFIPPPKVKSGVIRLTRNPKEGLAGNEDLFKKIVKAGFNQRRKKLSNSLKALEIPEALQTHVFMEKRAEELSVTDFIGFAREWQTAKF